MTVLVTGGAGFIGSALVRALVRDQVEVVTVDKLTYAGNPDNLASVANSGRHRLVQADIADAAAMRDVITRERPTVIYHLAAETHVDRSIDSPTDFIQTNVVGTLTLLEASLEFWRGLPADRRDGFRFVSVSTDEVFGDLTAAEPAFTEERPYRPSSPYAASKASADHLVRAWRRTYGLPVLISNCSNNYGPFQFPEKLIPTAILAALAGRPIPVYGGGENVRDWLHVDDHVAALRLIAARGAPGETYLIGARCERRNIDLVRLLCSLLDELRPSHQPHDRLSQFVGDRPGHDLRYAIDPGKLERELGWRPHITLEQGLRDTVAWYLHNPEWCVRAVAAGGSDRRGLSRAKP